MFGEWTETDRLDDPIKDFSTISRNGIGHQG
jgi:hypothetical protein